MLVFLNEFNSDLCAGSVTTLNTFNDRIHDWKEPAPLVFYLFAWLGNMRFRNCESSAVLQIAVLYRCN